MVYAQEAIIEWSPNFSITYEDSEASKRTIDSKNRVYSVNSGVMIDFAIQMSNVEFMFTKNFNSKLVCTFHKEAATLMAPDSIKANQLIQLVQFDFDLSELYTRKLRKELFENKKTFSDVTFFQPYFNKMITERNAVSSKMYTDSDFGNNTELLQREHSAIKNEILELGDYCKECKPPKKKKKN